MTRFSIDPPTDDGPDPDACPCGEALVTYAGPDGEREQVCPTCDRRMIAGELGGDDALPDSERTQRADIELDRQRDDALTEREVPF